MAKEHSYLYIIGIPGDRNVKVGRSKHPTKRRSALQVGASGKLALHGQVRVPAEQASALEAVAKAVLRPLRVQGEVFRASPHLACAVIEWIGAGKEADDFMHAIVAYERAANEFHDVLRLGMHKGRWASEKASADYDRTLAECDLAREHAISISAERFSRIWPEYGALSSLGSDETWKPKGRRRWGANAPGGAA